jgi:pSer/pThr/pTyr-binding forkhead associated (FHA) protein
VSPHPLDPHGSSPAELRDRLAAERGGRPFLVYRDGGGRQLVLELAADRQRVVIGRRSVSDLALEWDPEVSRVHASLDRVGHDWVLSDEGLSHNGTWVNGERVHGRRALRGGDVLSVGATQIVFCIPDSGSSSESTRTAADPRGPLAVTPAQRRVLVALCRPLGESGYAVPASNRAIADELTVTVDTVKGTLSRLFEAFELGDMPQNQKRAALARRALESGLVRRDEL